MEKTNRNIDLWIYRLAWMLSGLSARFTTSAYGDESARVASFSVDDKVEWQNTTELTADVTPGTSQIATIKIKNNSEVAVAYTVTVTNVTNNLPLKFIIDGDDGDPVADEYTYQSSVQANSGETSFKLIISWPADTTSADEKNLDYIGMVDYITVKVTATQID
jgi:hypothetical protein